MGVETAKSIWQNYDRHTQSKQARHEVAVPQYIENFVAACNSPNTSTASVSTIYLYADCKSRDVKITAHVWKCALTLPKCAHQDKQITKRCINQFTPQSGRLPKTEPHSSIPRWDDLNGDLGTLCTNSCVMCLRRLETETIRSLSKAA